jgi:hypothetical protein
MAKSTYDGIAALRDAQAKATAERASTRALALALSPTAEWEFHPVLREAWLTVTHGESVAEVWVGAYQVGLRISPPSGVGGYRMTMPPGDGANFRAWLRMRAKGGRGVIGRHRQEMARRLCVALGWAT